MLHAKLTIEDQAFVAAYHDNVTHSLKLTILSTSLSSSFLYSALTLSPITLSLSNSLPHSPITLTPHCLSLSLTTLPLSMFLPLNKFKSEVRVF